MPVKAVEDVKKNKKEEPKTRFEFKPITDNPK